jgi:iron complex outermembrane receptor protein
MYLQDQIKLADRWVATLGGRYDSAATETIDHLNSSTARQTDHQFTGRAGLVYLHPSGVAPYVSYAESFSPQTVINPESGSPFKPETGKQYEVGVRYQPPGRKETYSAAVFDLRRQNYVTYDTNYVPKQTGEVAVRGLELEAILRPIPNLNVTAAYSYTPKADVTKSSRPEEIGKQLTAVSRNQFSVWVDYRFSGGLKMGVGVLRSSSTQGYAETLAPRRIPAFTVIDAMVGYDYGPWAFALNARNLTDKVYLTSGVGFGANTNMGATSFGAPRSLIGTATYRW